MRDLKCYSDIKEENYDTYRDLHAIFQHPDCKQKGFTEKNTILVDSESRKCQLWLDNTIVSEAYTMEDVQQLPSKSPQAQQEGEEPQVRNREWQATYLQELTQHLISIVEGAKHGDVPAFLKANRLAKFEPTKLLDLTPEQLQKARAGIQDEEEPAKANEETKEAECGVPERS